MPSIENTDLLTKYSQRDLSFAGIPTTNLQGYWKLNGNANDESTNSYNLTANGSPTYTAGIFNDAVTLNGSSQYLSIADASCPNLEISTSQSWSVWIKPDTSPSTYSYRIINKGKLSLPNNRHEISLGTDDKVTFWLGGLTTNFNVTSSNTVNIGKWNSIVAIYDSSSTKLKVFVNGVKTEVTASGTVADSDANFLIGASSFGSGDTVAQWFDGQIDDVAIYNTALTDAQARNIYNTGGSCLGYWKLNQSEDTNTKLLLHFNGANNSTSTLETSTGKSISFAGNSKISTTESAFGYSSLYLDGTGDYLTTPDSTDWDLGTGDFTIDFWARFDDVTRSSTFIAQSQDNNNRWQISYIASPTNSILYVDLIVGGSGPLLVSKNWSPSNNVWYHIAFTRSGNDFRFFVDGTQVGTTTTSSASFSTFSSVLYIGTNWLSGSPLTPHKGYLDEVRFVKGVAKYTTNFTKPTKPYSFLVDDYTKNGYHLVSGNRPTSVVGYFDEAGDFNGTDNYIAGASNLSIDGSSLSVSFWIKPNDVTSPNGIFYKGTNIATRENLNISIQSTSQIRFGFYNDDLDSNFGGLQTGNWYHIACTYNLQGNARNIYINGVNVGTNTSGGSLSNTDSTNTEIGRIFNRNNEAFDGLIDDLAIFNRELTADEVYQIYLGFTPKISIIE